MKTIFDILSTLNGLAFIKYKDLDWYSVVTENRDKSRYITKYVSYYDRYHDIAVCFSYSTHSIRSICSCDERRRFA
jgi:hypothetical protein